VQFHAGGAPRLSRRRAARGAWIETLNSDAPFYGGSGVGNMGRVEAQATACHGRQHSLSLTLPPLGIPSARSRNARNETSAR